MVPALIVGAMLWIFAVARRQGARRDEIERRQKSVRERRARELGWRFDGTPDGDIRYRFEGYGADGLRWTMKFDSDAGSSSSTPTLEWQTTGLRSERIELMLGSRSYLASLTSGAGRKVIGAASFVLGRLVGASLQDMGDFVAAAQVVTLGTSERGFAAAARDGAAARRVLQDADVSRLLNAWPREVPKGFVAPQAVSAQLDREGLKVTVKVDGPDMALCEHLRNSARRSRCGSGPGRGPVDQRAGCLACWSFSP